MRRIIFSLVLAALSATAQARTYYVSTAGDDAAPGTASQPWRTITSAARTVSAGDTVSIAAGTYREYVHIASRSGAGAAPITFRAGLGERVVIDAAGFPNGLEIAESHIVVSGLEIINADGFGIAVRNSQHDVVIRDCLLHGNGSSGIKVLNSDAVRIAQVLIYGNGGHGVEVVGATAEVALRNATVWGNGGDGLRNVFGAVAVDDCIIADNFGSGIDALGDQTATVRFTDFWNNADRDVARADAVNTDATVLRADPLLHAPARGDFRLPRDSPAADSASDRGDMGYRFGGSPPPERAHGFLAATATGWTLDRPRVLLQTIYGTAQDERGMITANTPAALSLDKGMAVAFMVAGDTALEALRLKLQNLKPEVGLRLRLYDVSGTGILSGAVPPTREHPGGAGNAALFDRTYETPAIVPFHLEPQTAMNAKYSDLLADLGPLEVAAGEYLLVVDNVGPSNTIGSLIVGDEGESTAMGEYPDRRPLPGGARLAGGASAGNVRFYQLTSNGDRTYTSLARLAALQLTSTVVNHPPTVAAGADQLIVWPDNTAQLGGVVQDDGQPPPPAALTTTWSVRSGPGSVRFADPGSARTAATFSAFGTYVLRLTGDDAELVASDDVTIRWLPALPPNRAPVVDAGPDQEISLPRSIVVAGAVRDDGAPDPPASVRTLWSARGPGVAAFGDARALRTAVSFSIAGTYVLRLTADDGQDTAFDELTVVVRPFGSYQGYGAGATGGAGGHVVSVTTLADDGPGSLRDAVESLDGSPTIITFAVAGEIFVASELRIARDNVTVMGSSAPDPGITLNAAFSERNLGIKASNVIVENVRLRNAALENLVLWGGRDIVVDHCSLTWSGDGALDINGSAYGAGVNHVTISRSLFAGAVEVSRSRGHHISWHYNLFTHNNRRQPKIFTAGPDYNFACNYVRQWGNTAINIQDSAQVNIVNNFFGPPYPGEHWGDACYLSGITAGADVYTAGNAHAASTPGQPGRGAYDVNRVGTAPRRFESEPPPVAVTLINAADVPGNVLADVGALPRDAHDTAFIETYTGRGRETGGDPP